MKKQNILITGTNGMLGKDIVSALFLDDRYNIFGINRTKNNDNRIIGYNCDLTDFNSIEELLKTIAPNIIIHCAANVDVDFCEENRSYAYTINAKATKFIASYNPYKTKFYYISTDSVFDGLRGEYKEEDNPNPLNYYAYTKLEGERFVLNNNVNSVIIRTNIYGFHNPISVNSLAEWALHNFENANYISGFEDVFFNPVYTKQLAEVISRFIDIDFKGLINVGCKDRLTKYDFLIKLGYIFNYDKKLIGRRSVDSINFKAKRPKNTTLSTLKYNRIIDYEINIDDGLKALYEDYKKTISVKE